MFHKSEKRNCLFSGSTSGSKYKPDISRNYYTHLLKLKQTNVDIFNN